MTDKILRFLLMLVPEEFRVRDGDKILDTHRARAGESRSLIARTLFGLREVTGMILVALRLWTIRYLRIRREKKEQRGARVFESTWQDLCIAVRTLRRRPVFPTVAVVALGLGIGATTIVFSVADAAARRVFLYPEPDRLVSMWFESTEWTLFSVPDYYDLRTGSDAFESLALIAPGSASLKGLGNPAVLEAGEGTASLPRVLGIQPHLGRWFLPDEDGVDVKDVTVLGYGFWQERFGADPTVLGTTITLEDRPYEVIGVVSPEFRFRQSQLGRRQNLFRPDYDGEPDLWLPIGHNYGAREGHVFSARWQRPFEALGRLRVGWTIEMARGEVERLLQAQYPSQQVRIHVERRADLESVGLPEQILVLAFPSLLLLMIACGNVATLLVGEGIRRQGEMATRAALGAGVNRIMRQLMTENMLLGLLGSTAGAVVAFGITKLLVAFAPLTSTAHELKVSWEVLLLACFTGVMSGFIFGVGPALVLARRTRENTLRGQTSGLTMPGQRVTGTIFGLEIALSVVLLVSGVLFTGTVLNLFAVNVGFDPENLIWIRTRIETSSPSERPQTFQQLIRTVEAVPGVRAVTGSWSGPFVRELWAHPFEVDGLVLAEDDELPTVAWDDIMPGYHEVMGIPLLAGRYLTDRDGLGNARTCVVSESAARRFWPGRSPLGARIRRARDEAWATVVGVVGDVLYDGFDKDPEPTVYFSYLQDPVRHGRMFALTIRSSVEFRHVVPQLEAAIGEAENIVPEEIQSVESAMTDYATDQRYRALLVVTFGIAAIVLSAVGIFGITLRSLAYRSREFAVRSMLGAEPTTLQRWLLQNQLLTCVVGVTAGLVGALWVSRLLTRFLFEVQGWNPTIYGTVALLVLLGTGLASYLPSRRILRLQPAEVLRRE